MFVTEDRPHFPASELDYELPEELIAQAPAPERTAARLLVAHRGDGRLEDRSIRDLPAYLRAGDALVLNDTRVLPAKFRLRRASGGYVDGVYLETEADGCWRVLLRGAQRLRVGEELQFSDAAAPWHAILANRGKRGSWRIRVGGGASANEVLRQVGRMPLPPYIKRDRVADARDAADATHYQTVYAQRDGAVAAPTAGLHFTETLLDNIQSNGVAVLRVTLHVGYGTFAPLEVDDLADHLMHAEQCELAAETAGALMRVRRAGGRIAAVGTTSARVLESAWRANGWQGAFAGRTDLFCYPPYAFGGVDVLMTNFHLPRSTLLALVMAFAGVDFARRAYNHAIAERYRFYSYGDAMLIV